MDSKSTRTHAGVYIGFKAVVKQNLRCAGGAREPRSVSTACRGLRLCSEGWLGRNGRVFGADAGQTSAMAPRPRIGWRRRNGISGARSDRTRTQAPAPRQQSRGSESDQDGHPAGWRACRRDGWGRGLIADVGENGGRGRTSANTQSSDILARKARHLPSQLAHFGLEKGP